MACARSILPPSQQRRRKGKGSMSSCLQRSSERPKMLVRTLIITVFALSFSSSSAGGQIPFKDIGLNKPVIQFTPNLVREYSWKASEGIISCERVRVSGLSRLRLSSYANSLRVTLKPSEAISEKHYGKIEVCTHQNASLGLCQCGKEEWRTISKQLWSFAISPYEERYIDVKLMDGLSGSITISIKEEFQTWRLSCLVFGFALLLLAPIISHWVPFYYSSSMALGVLLVVLILLFQGMKLLPTGRKSVFYLSIYGSILGAGSFLMHYFSMLVSSVLANFGLSEDMYNPVSVFILLGIFLAGAAIGYWIVRKFILSEDGSVDVGVAQFVKWAMRMVAAVSLFQSSLDTLLAMSALVICWICCSFITKKWQHQLLGQLKNSVKGSTWQRKARYKPLNNNRAEFFGRAPNTSYVERTRGSPKFSNGNKFAWSNSPSKGLHMVSSKKNATNQEDYYSTFHKVHSPRRFSKDEWEDFTHESTRQAMAELVSSPEFTDWIMEHADRIRLMPDESSDESVMSESDSSEGNDAGGAQGGLSIFRWF